ncbi:MAG: hypothetical protein ACREGI_06015, partial [Candidatus Levyibacteriota bacterium]
MSTAAETGIPAQEEQGEAASDTDLLAAARNWRSERPVVRHFAEWKARSMVVSALRRDIKGRLVSPDSVLATTFVARQMLEQQFRNASAGGEEVNEIRLLRLDPTTKEPTLLHFKREADGLVAEEIGEGEVV